MDYMGAGLPIVAAMEGVQADIIRRHETGRVVPSFDHVGLANLVGAAANGELPLDQMAENGRRLVRERFLLPEILERYVNVVEAVARGTARGLPAWEPTT
jgi:glycosyltransferase involved in cell wall biosynthesis